MPGAETIVVLIRTSVLALSDAIQTGNFTVLRDLGAPGFRDANSAARLSHSFSDLARQGVDLSSVAIMVPQLSEAPVIDPKSNILRIKGWFPAQSMRVYFALMFQPIAGKWRLFGISVNPAPKGAAAAAAPAARRSPEANGVPKAQPKSDTKRKSP
jgi:hypothetical protein